MKCFNHRELDALAVCKHCGRALCSSCAAETEDLIACRGRCENFVSKTVKVQQAGIHSLNMQVPMYRWLAFFLYGIAAVMCGFAGFEMFCYGVRPPDILAISFGFVCLITGICSQRHARSIQAQL
jgi:hypothetical protein